MSNFNPVALDVLRWIGAAPLIGFGLLIGIGQGVYTLHGIAFPQKHSDRFVSMSPFIGGVALAGGLLLMPAFDFSTRLWMALVGLLLDFTIWLYPPWLLWLWIQHLRGKDVE